jgi:hypothetical protein
MTHSFLILVCPKLLYWLRQICERHRVAKKADASPLSGHFTKLTGSMSRKARAARPYRMSTSVTPSGPCKGVLFQDAD